MTLPLPNLDDRTYDDLLDEARTLIRTYQPEWTNYNPSDPGITLIELFAWLAEMLIYRCDQIPDRHRLAFLKLLNGPDWAPTGDPIDDQIATALTEIRRRHRAVTAEDYEALARQASPLVARALCVPRRDLSGQTEAARAEPRPGYVSVIVVPVAPEADAAAIRVTVRDDLEPRRLLTTQNVIADPVWTPVRARILVAPRDDVPPTQAALSVTSAVASLLDPRAGGRDGAGWPFGRDVYVSELYRAIEALPEVDYVPDVELSSACAAGDTRCAPGVMLWNAQGDQIGLQLPPHALPRLEPEPLPGQVLAGVVASNAFVPVRAIVTVAAVNDVTDAVARRRAKAAVRDVFEPALLRSRADIWHISRPELLAGLQTRLSDAAEVVDVALSGDARSVPKDDPDGWLVILAGGELPDVQTEVVVQP